MGGKGRLKSLNDEIDLRVQSFTAINRQYWELLFFLMMDPICHLFLSAAYFLLLSYLKLAVKCHFLLKVIIHDDSDDDKCMELG